MSLPLVASLASRNPWRNFGLRCDYSTGMFLNNGLITIHSLWYHRKMILVGDVFEKLKEIPSESVDCCVTSPPYYGLRDYGKEGQIGQEKTPEEYTEKIVNVFREVRRILKPSGTLWLNLGDSYAGSGRGGNLVKNTSTLEGGVLGQIESIRGSQKPCGLHESARQSKQIGRAWIPPPPGLRQKNLIGIPWRVAFALQEDGWNLRQDIIWSKPNPMPESVTDRCTKSHEYIFLLSKNKKYYFDSESIKEPAIYGSIGRSQKIRSSAKKGSFTAKGEPLPGQLPFRSIKEYRNKRSVWTVSTKPFKGAHFATFPPDLIRPCILAGSPPEGLVLDPFLGSGTTGLVAIGHNRKFLGIELNPEYALLASRRTGIELSS